MSSLPGLLPCSEIDCILSVAPPFAQGSHFTRGLNTSGRWITGFLVRSVMYLEVEKVDSVSANSKW